MTQLSQAQEGIVTPEIRQVAQDEAREPEWVRAHVASGEIVIPKNINHDFRPRGIGRGLRTKVNANLGTSREHDDHEDELKKLAVAVEHCSDSVMDLSTCHHIADFRPRFIQASPVMVGVVPVYQFAMDEKLSFANLDVDYFFDIIEQCGRDGVDYITVHCGVTRRSIAAYETKPRINGIVSKGGSFHAAWIKATGLENPLYEHYDRLLDICFKHDITLSLGDGLRPGAVHDADDPGQMEELKILGELQQRSLARGVQAMIEGPGHVPIHMIPDQVAKQKKYCNGAPFYVLGPLTCDVAPGYDHITGAIGGALAAACGVDMLCYVTPAEHLRLPDSADVRDGVIATRIAAHSGDLAKDVPGAMYWNERMSRHRKDLNWDGMYEMAMDPMKAIEFRINSESFNKKICSMCGTLCAININNKYF